MVKHAFTFLEALLAFVIVVVVLLVTSPVTLSKMGKVNSVSYYNAYETAWNISVNIYNTISMQIVDNSPEDIFYINDTIKNGLKKEQARYELCTKTGSWLNAKSQYCSGPAAYVEKAAETGDFNSIQPNLILSDNLKIYLSDYGEIQQLAGQDMSEGIVLYIDCNGNSGNGRLWEDVFSFYLTGDGKTIPGFPDKGLLSGGNNTDHISASVMYEDFDSGKREIKTIISDTDYKKAACSAGYIKSSEYCGAYTRSNMCKMHDCRLFVNEPLRVL